MFKNKISIIFLALILLNDCVQTKFTKNLTFLTASSLSVKRSGGYEEGAFVEWTGSTSDEYSVYYKSGGSYVQIDSMLIRQYSTYFRADAVGLKAGTYTLKVSGKSSGEVETSSLTVTSYDRSGFTFASGSPSSGKGIGAYNLDGTLKSGAQVLYVTEATKKSVKMTIKGTSYTGVSAITQQIKDKNSCGPVAIRIIGQVSLDGLSCSDMSSSYALGVKGASQVTFEGIGDDATLLAGVAAFQSTNIEVRNIGFMLWGGGKDGDGIALKASKAVWIHNNDIFYGLPGTDADQVKGDGSMDLKDDSQYVTISYNHFWDSGKMSLCGMKSESGSNWICYHHNWLDHSDSRHPRIRTMSVHVWNNYFDGNSKYGVGVTYGGEAFVESNYFRNCKYPMLISMQGSDSGTFSKEDGGVIKSYGNYMTGQKSYKTYNEDSTEFDAYEVSNRNDKVPSNVKAKQGGTTYSNFDTDSSKMYTYSPLSASNVPSVVKEKAGRINGGDFQFTFSSSDDTDSDVNSSLMSKLKAYKTGVISVGSGSFQSGGSDSGSGDSGSSGSGSSGSGSSTPITGTAVHNFSTDGVNSSYFTINGNLSSSKGTVTYNGLTLTVCLKLESATSITFTASSATKLTLVTDTSTSNFKLDGTKTLTDSSGVTTINIAAGEHTITKADTGNIFYIVVA